MARQGGQVLLEQPMMCLAMNLAKIAKGGFSPAAIEETQQLFKRSSTNIRDEKKRSVDFPRHKNVKAAIE
jgi:hypothetical protein